MPIPTYDNPALTGPGGPTGGAVQRPAQPTQAAEPAQQEEEEVPTQPPIPLPSTPAITRIHQIQNRPAELAALTNPTDTPENRLLNVFRAEIIGRSTEHNTTHNTPIPNRLVESFIEQVMQYLVIYRQPARMTRLMYNGQLPDRETYNTAMFNVRERVQMARQALLSNDPQLAMSILRNHAIRYDGVAAYQTAHEDVDVHEDFGPDATTQPEDSVLLLDSAYLPSRFLIRADQLPALIQHSITTRNTHPDGPLEDIPHSIITSESNTTAAALNLQTLRNTITDSINEITHQPVQGQPQHPLQTLYTTLRHHITIWSRRTRNPLYRHPDLPAPRIEGSINFHRLAPSDSVLRFLSALAQRVRTAHAIFPGVVGRQVPRWINDFIARNPADEGSVGARLEWIDLGLFVALAGDEE